MSFWGSQDRCEIRWTSENRDWCVLRVKMLLSNLQEWHSVEQSSSAHTQSWAIQRQKDNCWGLQTPISSSAPPKLDPGDIQWDPLCFCCKAPALLNTHSESLGKLCNHALASWQRAAVWLQFLSAPWERTGFCGNQGRRGPVGVLGSLWG